MSKSSNIITRRVSNNRALKTGVVLVSACTLFAAYAGKRYYTRTMDTTPPTASITSPTASTTVSGAVAVAVAATDNVGVARVDLYVNGTLSASLSAAPYAFNVDTSKLTNGSTTFTAIAYDKAGNKASSAPVAVTVSNTSTTSTTSTGSTSTTTPTTTTTDTTGSTSTTSTSTSTSTTTSTTTTGTTSGTTTGTGSTTTISSVSVGACQPSGLGKDYQVGPGTGQLASLDQVPWDKLVAGDTVRIFYSDTPYRGKFMISGNGTAAAPIRVCGVKSATGQRPIVDGQNAVSRIGLPYGNILHETRSVIVVKQLSTAAWTAYPSYIQIDGLEIRGATPANTFTDSTGTVRPYETFGACIWLDRGQNVTIADNVIHDCTNGIYSKSTNDGDFAVTKNILLSGNYIYGNGVVGDEHEHNVYMESVNITYEFNRFEPLRTGALGNAIKDRSAGTVVRYNYINGGSHSVDLVEAEDFYTIASTYASYRSSFVYGNIIVKDGSTGSVIHYGGDHYYSTPGSAWGEPIFRAGTLYFYDNTLNISGTSAQVFQLSTTLESAQVWNNVFNFASTVTYPSLRATTDLNTTYWTAGGVLTLGKNWSTSTLADSDPWHPVPGTVTGWANLIKGTSLPTDSTYTPLSGSAIVNTAQSDLSAVAAYPVQFQFDLSTFSSKARTLFGTAADMGAVERMTN